MLESVGVHVDKASGVDERTSSDFLLRLGWRLSDELVEVLLNGFARVDVSEGTPVLSCGSLVNFE